MTPDARQKLVKLLEQQEGYRQFLYMDTRGNPSIGIGRCLNTRGISLDEAIYLLDNDIQDAEKSLWHNFPEYNALDDVRKIVLVDLVFNMGIENFMQFRNMLDAVKLAQWEVASKALLNSEYAKQVPTRAEQLAYILEKGEL